MFLLSVPSFFTISDISVFTTHSFKELRSWRKFSFFLDPKGYTFSHWRAEGDHMSAAFLPNRSMDINSKGTPRTPVERWGQHVAIHQGPKTYVGHGGRYNSRATASPAPSLGQVEPQKLSHRACGMSTQCWHHTRYSVLHSQTLITILNSLSLTFHPNWGLLVQMNPSGPGLFHKVLRESRRTNKGNFGCKHPHSNHTVIRFWHVCRCR